MSAHGETEENVIKMEENIIAELEDVTGKVAKISKKEKKFLDNARENVPVKKMEDNIASFEIFLEKDVTPELKDIQKKVNPLEDALSNHRNTVHTEILEHLVKALNMMEKEEVRFQKLLKTAEDHLEKTGDVSKVKNRILEFQETEERQSIGDVKMEITRAESLLQDYEQMKA